MANKSTAAPKVRIGIIGGRGVGKTSFLASMFEARDPEGGVITISDESSALIAGWWETLQSGKVIPASPAGAATAIRVEVVNPICRWDVTLHDYAGALVETASLETSGGPDSEKGKDEISEQLKREIAKLFDACDALLFFLPVDLLEERGSTKAGLYLSVVDKVIRHLPRPGAEAGSKPCCVALSKWDKLDDKYRGWKDYIERQPLLAKCTALHNFSDNIYVMPVSAFGAHSRLDPSKPPEGGISPFNVYESLEWLCVETDRMRKTDLEKCIAGIKKETMPFFRSYALARAYRAADGAIGDPGYAGEIKKNHAKYRRRARLASAIMCLLLIAAAVGGYRWLCGFRLARENTALEQTLRENRVTGMIQAGEYMRSHWFFLPRLLNPPDYAAFEAKWHGGLDDTLAGLEGDAALTESERYRKKSTLLGIALATTGDKAKVLDLEDAIAKERRRYDATGKYQDFDREYAALRREAEEGLPGRVAAFMAKYPVVDYPDRGDVYEEMKELRRDREETILDREQEELDDLRGGERMGDRLQDVQRRLQAYDRFAERRKKEGMETASLDRLREKDRREQERLKKSAAFEQAYAEITRKIDSSKDDIFPYAEVDTFLAVHSDNQDHPSYREIKNILGKKREEDKRLRIAKLMTEAGDAYKEGVQEDYRKAVEKYQALSEQLAKEPPNFFSEEKAMVAARLHDVREKRDDSAYRQVKRSFDDLDQHGASRMEAAIEACGRYLDPKSNHTAKHANRVKEWSDYLKNLQKMKGITVELAYLSIEGSPFMGGFYDRNFGWHYLSLIIQNSRGKPLIAFAGETLPKPEAQSGVRVERDEKDPSYFRINKPTAKFAGERHTIDCNVKEILTVRLTSFTGSFSVGEKETGNDYKNIFSIVWNCREDGRVEQFLVATANKSNPATVILRFSGFPKPPEALP